MPTKTLTLPKTKKTLTIVPKKVAPAKPSKKAYV